RVWNHKAKSGHDAFGKFVVRLSDKKHPLTEGLKAFEVVDELYFQQDGAEPIEPLIVAESKVTKRLEPLAWTSEYGKGRVFQTLLGHSEKTYDAFEAREMLRRAAAWVAGRTVRPVDPKKAGKSEIPPPLLLMWFSFVPLQPSGKCDKITFIATFDSGSDVP